MPSCLSAQVDIIRFGSSPGLFTSHATVFSIVKLVTSFEKNWSAYNSLHAIRKRRRGIFHLEVALSASAEPFEIKENAFLN